MSPSPPKLQQAVDDKKPRPPAAQPRRLSSGSQSNERNNDMFSMLEATLENPAPAFFVPNAPQVPHSLAAQTNVTNPMSTLARDGPGSLEPSKPSGPLAAMPTSFCTCDRAAGEKCTFCWAWEPSEAGSSMPSVWSQATSRLTSGALSSGVYSKISLSSGVTISGNWLQGQRIHYVKPDCIPSKGGATVVVGLKKEIPQDMWNALEIVFRRHDRRPTTRNSPQLGTARPPDSPQAIPAGFVKTFKPEGIRKGKKLAVKIRGDFPPGDYDVSVCFAGRMLHGTLPIEVVEKKELNDRDNESGTKPRADASSSSSHHSTPGMPPALASLLGTTNSIPEGGQLENPLMRALGGSGLPPAATDESK
ncbi:hypothetical protein FOZ63_007596 [Perkinsus olseni]|uniref:Uncharacterized protein n=1 Tax=Perkinsus olseni TaxID=32597 RepID=A0A7J6NA39_PEROL|nr:hypothetical protein FOZ63_007596 [Perkinsus olseni]